ncbi:hypothetical protein N39L_02610 [Limnospira platensis NIES-39]|uniref:Uncharacterized protein n=3 Tax=Limnospira platensis TaxID=118562 RepID=A0A5M3T4Y2_LIMPL|nr:hypothetical protein N39L_02610 [Arthrospira platensis NIES-39]GCE92589.1 hypothetical protein NIES46_06290 [Arthrospira platensis NIES-46]
MTWKNALIPFMKLVQKPSFNIMPYLMDTNHCSYIINGNVQVLNVLNNHRNDAIGISIITYAELLYMADKSGRQSENITAVKEFLGQVDLYFLDEETAIFYRSD